MLIILIPGLKWYLEFRKMNGKNFAKEGILLKIWAFRKGFYLETIKYCGITKANVHEYLSDRAYLKLHPINHEYSKIIDNKLYLPYLLKDYPELVPTYYYLIEKGRCINIDPLFSSLGLLQLCKVKRRLALKPCSSTMGNGFYILEWNFGRFFLNNIPVDIHEINCLIESLDSYLVTEYVIQHNYSDKINHSSVNTIRLICLRDGTNNEFFIPTSNHRFGVGGKVVDNVGAEGGAVAAYIDVLTGRIKNIGIIKENGMLSKISDVIRHPDSNQLITGIFIPNWTEMINKVLEVMNHLSFLKYVGLDVVMTEDGFKILEINSLPTLIAIQIEAGALKNDQVKRFFLDNQD